MYASSTMSRPTGLDSADKKVSASNWPTGLVSADKKVSASNRLHCGSQAQAHLRQSKPDLLDPVSFLCLIRLSISLLLVSFTLFSFSPVQDETLVVKVPVAVLALSALKPACLNSLLPIKGASCVMKRLPFPHLIHHLDPFCTAHCRYRPYLDFFTAAACSKLKTNILHLLSKTLS